MCDFFDFGPGGDSGEYSGETGGETSGETVDSATETGGETEGEKGGEGSKGDGSETGGTSGGKSDGGETEGSGGSSGGKGGMSEPGGKEGSGGKVGGKLDLGSEPGKSHSGKLDLGDANTETGAKIENAEGVNKETDNEALKYEPQSRVKIDGTYYRTDDNGKIHMYRDNADKLYKLNPNDTYTSKGCEYQTDDKARISTVHNHISVTDAERGSLNAKVEDMRVDDHRGHVVAARNGGSDRIDNVVPMAKELNNGEYKTLENFLNDEAAAGKDVDVTYHLLYNKDNDSKRPDKFVVEYTITDKDGTQISRDKTFVNGPQNS